MTTDNFNQIVETQLDYCKELLCSKGKEYAKTTDRLEAFKTAAEIQHITPKQALAGMMCKHTVSIYDMCKADNEDLDKWIEKITDNINYLIILRAVIMEESEWTKPNII